MTGTTARRSAPAWWLAGAGAAMLVLGLVFGVRAVRTWDERAAYLRAAPCSGGATAGCVEEVPARVVAPGLVSQRDTGPGDRPELKVPLRPEAEPARQLPAARVHGRDLDELERDALYHDAAVTAGFWRGRPARLDPIQHGRIETRDSPVALAPRRTLEALLALAAGAGMLLSGLGRGGRLVGAVLLAVGVGLVAAYDTVLRFAAYDAVRPLATFLVGAALIGVVAERARRRRPPWAVAS